MAHERLAAFLADIDQGYAQYAGAFIAAEFNLKEELAYLPDSIPGIPRGALLRIKAVATAAQPGAAPSDAERFHQLEARIAEVELSNIKASHTTRTIGDIGKDYIQGAADSACVLQTNVTFDMMDKAVKAVVSAFPDIHVQGLVYKATRSKRSRHDTESGAPDSEVTHVGGGTVDEDNEGTAIAGTNTQSAQQAAAVASPHGMTLADATRWREGQSITEEGDMQPAVVKVLKAVREAVDCPLVLVDTHKQCDLRDPASKPDSVLFTNKVQAWSTVGVHMEFKLDAADRPEMIGQMVQRSAAVLSAQKMRQKVYAVGITMNTLEVTCATRQPKGRPSLTTTGAQPFSISPESPGFKLLVQVMATNPSDLGCSTVLPTLPSKVIEKWQLSGPVLLRMGSAQRACSHVFRVDVQGTRPAVLKLNTTSHERDVLAKLQGVPHIVQAVGHAPCWYEGAEWHALLLEPHVCHLTDSETLQVATQVVADVASAIGEAAQRGVLHRDVTPNNFGHCGGKGYLFDFSAAQVVRHQAGPEAGSSLEPTQDASSLQQFTGTLMWGPLSALCGKPHTISSQLEGLFISMAHISMGGRRWPGRSKGASSQPKVWQSYRLLQFMGQELLHGELVAKPLRPLITTLHDLFWPLPPDGLHRTYRTDVGVAEVVAACQAVLAQVGQ